MKNRFLTLFAFIGLFCFVFTENAFAGDVTIHVTKSDGANYSGVKIYYYDGYWKNFGTTNGSGTATKTIPDGTYNFKASIGGTEDIKSFNVTGNTSGAFQSSKVTVQVTKSTTADFAGVATYYYAGYWRSMGNTNTSGESSVEIFDGTYNFKASVGGTSSVQNSVAVTNGSKISFQTSKVTAKVTKSTTADYAGVATYYYAGYWRSIGNTNSNGEASVEIFDDTYNFKASVGGTTSAIISQSVINGSIVPFQTSLGTFEAQSSEENPMQGVSMYYYAGYWRSVGTTGAGGTATKELFPGAYQAKASLGGTSAVSSITINSPGSVTFYTTKVTAKAEDCDNGDPISSVTMYYYAGYWRSMGNTNGSGETSRQLFPGTYNFRGKTGGTTSANQSHEVPGDGVTANSSTTVTFSPTRVELEFSSSVKYYSGYWRTLSNPDYLFPGTYDFKFDGHEESLTISGCELSGNVHVFKTLKADGSPLPDIGISRNDYGNHYVSVGTTDANGILFVTTEPAGDWKFRANKDHTSQYITSGPAVITFQTARFIVHAKKSDCTTDFEGIAASYNDYGNHYLSMGNTDANGQADIELFPGNYKFRASKDHTSKTGYLELLTSGTSGTIELQTSKYIVHVKNSEGEDYEGIAVSFNDYGNHYLGMGNTDVDGKAEIELFPGNRKFRAYKNHTANTDYLDIPASCSEDIVVFQTALVTGFARDCDSGSPISGIKISFNDYGNHYLNMGNTDSEGKAYIELFPGEDYEFRGYTIHTSENKTVDLTASGVTVEFNPTRVCFNYDKVRYNDYGNHWYLMSCNEYMFPGTYDFRFYTGSTLDFQQSIAISGCVFEKAPIFVQLKSSLGNGLPNADFDYRFGWGSYTNIGVDNTGDGIWYLIDGNPGNTKVKVTYAGASKEIQQNVQSNNQFIFNTVLVTADLQESDDDDITTSATWEYRYGWGTHTAFDPVAGIERLPVNTKVKVTYLGASVEKQQNVGSNSHFDFNTVLVTADLQESDDDDITGRVQPGSTGTDGVPIPLLIRWQE